jgi:hypothetical protein
MPHEHKITEERRTMIAEALFSFWRDVLSDESAPVSARKEAAAELKAYYRQRLATMGALLKRFGK